MQTTNDNNIGWTFSQTHKIILKKHTKASLYCFLILPLVFGNLSESLQKIPIKHQFSRLFNSYLTSTTRATISWHQDQCRWRYHLSPTICEPSVCTKNIWHVILQVQVKKIKITSKGDSLPDPNCFTRDEHQQHPFFWVCPSALARWWSVGF